jgi:hypothetical protein
MRKVRRRGCHPGGRSLFKGGSPHSRPQASWAKPSPTRSKVLPLRHGAGSHTTCKLARTEEAKPPCAERVTAQRLQALLHPRLTQQVKGWTTMQAACNCTTGMHPFDFNASSMEAQAHTSCDRRAGCYVRKTAPPLMPILRLLDCGTGAATQGDPAHSPTVPTRRIGHGSVSRGRRRDDRYGQKWADSNGGSRRAEAAVKSSAGSRPLLGQQESPLPRREDSASVFCSLNDSRNGCPTNHSSVALTPRQGRRHLWQARRATLHLRHNDRIKKGAPHRSNSYPFPLPLSLSCYRDRERGYSERDPSLRRKRAPSPPTDQGVRRLAPRKGSTTASEHPGSVPTTGQRFEGWPLGRVQQPPQATRAPRPLLIRGSKAGPPKGSTAALEHAE